ncbi:hypothetical protein Cflav_PD3460 [Pedosphaera parvula Ellin514]|uniref:Uncharacterized protein n=1 Tax=Pedosphaera parvula (strain Ellin514) TaxID=320771 RepID=B9XHZ7_PEDPL|nr:hypothetical protein Cflav_PD3460 [Pedosphaera parvula Ellin514]
MRDRLTSVRTVIDDETVTGILDSQFVGDFCSLEEQVTQKLGIIRFRIGDARNDFLRNDQRVSGGTGFNVPKGEHEIIFVNDVRRDLAGNNFFKQGHRIPRCNPGVRIPNSAAVLLYHKGATGAMRLLAHASAEKFNNLIFHLLATDTPTLGANELFHAIAQSLETKHLG